MKAFMKRLCLVIWFILSIAMIVGDLNAGQIYHQGFLGEAIEMAIFVHTSCILIDYTIQFLLTGTLNMTKLWSE